jgi:hypothetical protein
MKENDSSKLLIEDISGGEALSFWSRIAARHIHQPRIVIKRIRRPTVSVGCPVVRAAPRKGSVA